MCVIMTSGAPVPFLASCPSTHPLPFHAVNYANNKGVDCHMLSCLPGAIGVGQEVLRAPELEGFLLCLR